MDIVQSKSSLLNGGVLSKVFTKKNQMALVRDSIARFAYLNNACAIDMVVTDNMRGLLRVPGSIHGKTGLPCMLINRDELNSEAIKRKVPEVVGTDLLEVSIPHLTKTPFGVYEAGVAELPRYEALAILATIAHEKN